MKRVFVFSALAIILGLSCRPTAGTSSGSRFQIAANFGATPLYFIANRGQAAPEARFYARTGEYTIWLTQGGLVFDQGVAGAGAACAAVTFLFKNASPNVRLSAADPSDYRVSYFYGRDESEWKTDIPTSRAVLYKNLYDGIDLKVYGTDKKIEYDWIVRPGADSNRIRFAYEGAQKTDIDRAGDLVVKSASGELRNRMPSAYQVIDGKRVNVRAAFKKIGQDEFGFAVGEYKPRFDLVIDPIIFVYSTYLGGHGNDFSCTLALDTTGAVYIAGYTQSQDFPPVEVNKPRSDAYVTKLASDGKSLIYSAFFPMVPLEEDDLVGLAVDAKGSAYLVGGTNSRNFPVKNAFQKTIGGGGYDGFFLKLTPNGKGLVFSSYLGGSGNESCTEAAVDASGSLFIGGWTTSRNFPIRKAFQQTLKGIADLFVAKFDPDGKSLAYSTYLGGDKYEDLAGFSLDDSGSVYLTGMTTSTAFPNKNAFQKKFGGGPTDAFILKLASEGDKLIYSSYLGGSSKDYALGLTIDGSGAAYVSGYTEGSFPLKNALQKTRKGGVDGFVTKVSPDGKSLAYSTYLGGASWDFGRAIAVDSAGRTYIAGTTASYNFPVKDPFQSVLKGGQDGFLSIISPSGKSFVLSTYLGGSYWDDIHGMVLNADGDIIMTGNTNSLDFPLSKPFQKTLAGKDDIFVSKLRLSGD